MSFRERLVLGDFAALAVLWITRDPKFIPGWGSLFERGFVSDGTVAALEMRDQPVFGVQYHPEASPGPHDADHHFSRFTTLMAERRNVDSMERLQ